MSDQEIQNGIDGIQEMQQDMYKVFTKESSSVMQFMIDEAYFRNLNDDPVAVLARQKLTSQILGIIMASDAADGGTKQKDSIFSFIIKGIKNVRR